MSDLLVGDTTYRLTRKIAEGGMGSVFEATQHGAEGFQKQVAIKTVRQALGSMPEFVEMFIGEAKLVADLVHENIVQVYQLHRQAERLYIVMEYIEGIDLAQFMKRHAEERRRVPVEIASFIISRVCRGLDYAHGKRNRQGVLLGVVHRDVSPRNIMITRQGVVKLGDFGVAKAHRILVSREGRSLVGKARYMSPEQAELGQTDKRSDLFSLGVVFYELLTGVSIFKSDGTVATLNKVIQAQVPSVRTRNPGVPDEVVAILMKALARDPEDRFGSAGEMGYALEYYMYHDRFGPTNVTLESYLADFLPDPVAAEPHRAEDLPAAVDVGDRATFVVQDDIPTAFGHEE